MKPDRERPGTPGFEYIEDDINWTDGAGRAAGLYWLGGHSQFATHGSAAEQRLLERGAVLIATLRYDRDPLETTVRCTTVERASALRIRDAFLVSGVN